MAIGKELVAATAAVTGMRLTTVETHLRNLREAGLVSRSGRGPSAAAMKVSDATALLFALLGSAWVKDSEQSFRVCSQLSVHGKVRRLMADNYGPRYRQPRGDKAGSPKIDLLQSLPAGHTLETAFRRLFDVAQQEVEQEARWRLGLAHKPEPVSFPEGMEVVFLLPGNRFVEEDGEVVGRVVIRLKRPMHGDAEEAVYGGEVKPSYRRGRFEMPTKQHGEDLVTQRSITQHTFIRLIECLTLRPSGD